MNNIQNNKKNVWHINETGFLGLLINIQSLQTLFETVGKTKKDKYLSTYRPPGAIFICI